MNAIVEQQTRSVVVTQAATVAEHKAQVKRIREAMKSVMEPGVHYGVIPGTGKPTLYKPGSETLLSMFRIAVEPEIEDLSTDDEIRYRVKARGVHSPSGTVIGYGVGEASTNEEKYRWRNAVCDEEFEDTDEDRRRIKWQKLYYDKEQRKNVYEPRRMVRTVPADLANTVLKMAKKRAQIDLTLTALAASDVFNQDMEDLAEELRATLVEGEEGEPQERQPRGKPQTQAPRARSNGNGNGSGRCTEKQAKLIGVRLDSAGIPEREFLRRFGINAIEELPFGKVNEALAWIQNPDDGGGDRDDDIGDGRASNGYPD